MLFRRGRRWDGRGGNWNTASPKLSLNRGRTTGFHLEKTR